MARGRASEPKVAPRLGELDAIAFLEKRETPGTSVSAGKLPLAGTRIIDATAWWAGPSSTHILAALGAEVIHLESVQHPDGARMTAGAFMDQPSWWERSAMFLATNANKKGMTLDLSSPKGRELFFRLAEQSDVVVENFSPRVFENFGITLGSVEFRQPSADHDPHARLRSGRTVAGQRRVRPDYGTDDRHGLGDGP